jgi:hypothetical protein
MLTVIQRSRRDILIKTGVVGRLWQPFNDSRGRWKRSASSSGTFLRGNPDHEKELSMAARVPCRLGPGADGPHRLPDQRGRNDASVGPLSGTSASVHPAVAGLPAVKRVSLAGSGRCRGSCRWSCSALAKADSARWTLIDLRRAEERKPHSYEISASGGRESTGLSRTGLLMPRARLVCLPGDFSPFVI